MSDSEVYLPSASSTVSCDTSYASSKEEMEVASTIQPNEGEPRASKRRFQKTLTRTVSRLRTRCSGQD